MAKPGTDGINRYATGRVDAAGVLVTAIVGGGVAVNATEGLGDIVGAGVATHAGTESDTASART